MILLALMLATVAPPFGSNPWAGCVVKSESAGVEAECLGTTVQDLVPGKAGVDEVARRAEQRVRGLKWTDYGEPVTLTTTPPPLRSVVLQDPQTSDLRIVAVYADRVITCTHRLFDLGRCDELVGKLLGGPSPPDGVHPIVLFDRALSLSGCTWDQPVSTDDAGPHLRCPGSRLALQSITDPSDAIESFTSLAGHALDVPCRFLGASTTCRAARSWPIESGRHARRKPWTPPRSLLTVWIVDGAQRLICHSEGPTLTPLCASLFSDVSLSDDGKTALPLPPPVTFTAKTKPADPLLGCRLERTPEATVALCSGVTVIGWRLRHERSTWKDLMIADVRHMYGDTELVSEDIRLDERERATILTFSPGKQRVVMAMGRDDGRAFTCDARGDNWRAVLPSCVPRMFALAAADNAPPVFEYVGVRYSVPEGCSFLMPGAVACPRAGALQVLAPSQKPIALDDVKKGPGSLLLPRDAIIEEVPCSVLGASSVCVSVKMSVKEQSVRSIYANGPGWVATCTSNLPGGGLPPVCAPFVTLP
ncbi:MAG: hypothetical protein Q8O67_29095 [Deltaproteobacteria bacterium]|nr:hypothetical protein [Deltaproteobacteria bacterium]